jgi:hypothetical protein
MEYWSDAFKPSTPTFQDSTTPIPREERALKKSNFHEFCCDGERIARLERKGLIRRGSGDPKKWLAKRRVVKLRGSVLKDLLDERRSGW